MGWYHGEQLLKGQCPSAKLCYIIEPWFLGPGKYAHHASSALVRSSFAPRLVAWLLRSLTKRTPKGEGSWEKAVVIQERTCHGGPLRFGPPAGAAILACSANYCLFTVNPYHSLERCPCLSPTHSFLRPRTYSLTRAQLEHRYSPYTHSTHISGADGPGGSDFKDYKDRVATEHGVQFATSLSDLPPPTKPRMALISGRTADNPRLLNEAIQVRESTSILSCAMNWCDCATSSGSFSSKSVGRLWTNSVFVVASPKFVPNHPTITHQSSPSLPPLPLLLL